MKFNGNITLNPLGQSEVQNLVVERLASNPVVNAAEAGRLIFNTADKLFYMNVGDKWVALATGGDAASLQTEVDNIEAALGSLVSASGSFVGAGLSGILAGATSVTEVIERLRAAAASNTTAIGQEVIDRQAADAAEVVARDAAIAVETAAREAALAAAAGDVATEVADLVAADAALQTALDTEAATRAAADIALQTAVDNEATARADGDAALQAAITADAKTRGDADTALSDRITLEVTDRTNADTALAAAVAKEAADRELADDDFQIALDAEITARSAEDVLLHNKIESAIAGLTWENAVDKIVADVTLESLVGVADGTRLVDQATNKIFTVTGEALDAGEVLVEGAAFFDKETDVPYVFNGVALTQFNGASSITAGAGLVKAGNTLDIVSTTGSITVTADSIDVSEAVLGSITTVATNLASEVTRATTAESGLGDRIDDEAEARIAADAVMTSAYEAGDAAVAATVTAEVTRAKAAEQLLQDNIAAEAAARIAADAAEVIARDAAIALEATAREQVATDLAAEVARATAAEAALSANVSKGYHLYEAAEAATSHVVAHNIGSKFCNVTVIDGDEQIIPQAVVFNSASQLTVTFNVAVKCTVVVMGLAVELPV